VLLVLFKIIQFQKEDLGINKTAEQAKTTPGLGKKIVRERQQCSCLNHPPTTTTVYVLTHKSQYINEISRLSLDPGNSSALAGMGLESLLLCLERLKKGMPLSRGW